MSYSTDDEQDSDLDSFIASFQSESEGQIIGPGSYIQFLTEPAVPASSRTTPPDTEGAQNEPPSIIFGSGISGATPPTNPPSEAAVEIIDGHFGAVSEQGLFLSSDPEGQVEGDERYPTKTKIDAPNTYIWEGRKRWI